MNDKPATIELARFNLTRVARMCSGTPQTQAALNGWMALSTPAAMFGKVSRFVHLTAMKTEGAEKLLHLETAAKLEQNAADCARHGVTWAELREAS